MNRMYHKCALATETTRNGIIQAKIDTLKNKNSINFFSNYLSKSHYTPPENINFIDIKLTHKLKLTDFISFSPFLFACPFILSNKTIQIFNDFVIQKHYYLDTSIITRNKLVDNSYRMMCCPYLDYDIFDYNQSKFYFTEVNEANEYIFKDIDINSANEYVDFNKRLVGRSIEAEKLVLNSSFDNNLDFINIKQWGMYVSERLKQAILDHKLTGLDFTKYSDWGSTITVDAT